MTEAKSKPKQGVHRPSWDEYFMDIVSLVARRSTCLRRGVGAVLVKDKRLLTTGYNGAPSGLRHCLRALVVLTGETGNRDLSLIDLVTGTRRTLTGFGREIAVGDFDVAPDGREIVFDRRSETSDVLRSTARSLSGGRGVPDCG